MPGIFDPYPRHSAFTPSYPRPLPGALEQHHALMSPPATNSSLSDTSERAMCEEDMSDVEEHEGDEEQRRNPWMPPSTPDRQYTGCVRGASFYPGSVHGLAPRSSPVNASAPSPASPESINKDKVTLSSMYKWRALGHEVSPILRPVFSGWPVPSA